MYKETIAVHCIIRRTDTVEQSPFSASKEIPEFYDNGRFVAAFTSTNQLSLCYARSIQYLPSHPTSWKPIQYHPPIYI